MTDTIASLRLERRLLKKQLVAMTVSRDNHKRKETNVLKAIVNLREDGFAGISNQQIADRYFTTTAHIIKLACLIRNDK